MLGYYHNYVYKFNSLPHTQKQKDTSFPFSKKEWELARMATVVITAGRRDGRQAKDWQTFNEKRIKQAKTGLFIQNLCETEHPGDYEHAGIFIPESRRDLGLLYEMAPVRIVANQQRHNFLKLLLFLTLKCC